MKLKQEPIGIGQNLRKLRQDAGYSQSQVAALLCERGVYMTTDIYKKIEQNKYNIRISELNALKELYQVGYEELFQADSWNFGSCVFCFQDVSNKYLF